MLADYGHIAILLGFAILFPAGAVITSFLFSKLRIRPVVPSDPVKEDTYECGLETEGPSWIQFNIRYYNFALLFVLFDIEALFLFPIAAALGEVELFGKVAALVFVFIVADGLFYAWKNKALEWA